MYNVYNIAVPKAVERVSEPSWVAPADPHIHKRTLQNVLPKRGFEYPQGRRVFEDVQTRNKVLDAMREANGLTHKITPRVVDALLEQLILHLSERVPLLAVGAYRGLISMMKRHDLVPWIKSPNITPEIVDHLLQYLVKARQQAKATAKDDANNPPMKPVKLREPSKTALAIDAYLESLARNDCAFLIPLPEDKSGRSLDPGWERGKMVPWPETGLTLYELLGQAKDKADAAHLKKRNAPADEEGAAV